MNAYGPTECSIATHFVHLDVNATISIGPVIPNVNCYVLDSNQQPVPISSVGEVYLGGIGVVNGYINLQDETSARFMADPFAGTGTMFRTGDLGRLLPDGNFEILGRQDSQVKLKGYRIELDEVAEAMMQHPAVVSAAVIVKNKTHLVGFFTPPNVDHDDLSKIVATLLPVYMVPAVWVGLSKLPQNANGKVDKKALEEIQVTVDVTTLVTETETRLAAVWAQVLNASNIGRHASFFALGGDSITAIRLVSKAKTVGLALTSRDILKNPTLMHMAEVAHVIDQPDDDPQDSYVAASGNVPLTPIQHLNFSLPWHNIHCFNQSTILKARQALSHEDLTNCVSTLVSHHDMLRTRFYFSTETGWTQCVIDEPKDCRPNVEIITLASIDRLNAAVWTKENSLHLTDGPIYAVTLFELPNGDQYLHITIHHTLVDFVSYRILFDDLQLLLSGAKLGSKTMSFKEWSERQSAQALLWDPALWTEYMTTDALPPAEKCSYSKIKARGSLNATLTEKLDQANVVYGTNVQELALGALTCALGQLRQNVEGYQLPLMLEGHGREPWDLSTDVSNTIGWFTTLYPIVFTATSNIGDLLRQVKQKIRAVPHNGLSYGAIKYLTPATDATVAIKAHRQHNLSFNYAGRFQEMNAQSGLFETVQAVADVIGPEEVNDFIENIYLHHEGSSLVLDLSVAEWLFSKQDLERWIDLWVVWMEKIVDHCLDPNTFGGRTLSDVPLLRSASVVANVEAELLSTLDMRPLDVEDIYPVTPLQAGMLSAMIQDSSEYVLHATMDIRGDLEFSRLQSCWVQLAEQESLLRTVFVSTP
ncbi:hypothetical protein As57867_004835, partial [Aphanomyces stellatus]